ncbi:MAG: UPF0158 family protein [bacterium]|nr:UPF0158 family protein [bacterium]
MKLNKDILMGYFEYSDEMPNSPYYLHRETGKVIDSKEYDALLSPDEEDDLSILDDYIELPRQDSREGYEDMKAFTQTVKDKHHRELLNVALSGWEGVFGRFDYVIQTQNLREWYKFRDERKYKRIIAWLKGYGIEPSFI